MALRAWRDGALRGSYTDPVVRESMGGGQNVGINLAGYGAEGAMDDFRIYNRALSESEIQALVTGRELKD